MRNRYLHLWVVLITLAGLLGAAWFFAGPVKGDPEETMAQMREYQQLARQYPAK